MPFIFLDGVIIIIIIVVIFATNVFRVVTNSM